MARHKFNGVVLAGGLSSRMGQDKALLSVNNETLLQRAKRVLMEAGAEQVLISRNHNDPEFILDIYPQHGPLSGIHAALMAQDLPLLFLPIDMPHINAESLKTLAVNGGQMESIVTYVDHNLPIYIPNTVAIRRYLKQTLTGKRNKSIRHFLLSMGCSQLIATDLDQLLNVNSPSDWHQAQNIMIRQEQ